MIKIKNSENLYPTIFKEHLLLCLLKSSYKEDIIIEDVENITLLTSIIKLNGYTINKFLKEIFNNYKELSFKISNVNMLYYTNTYQKYEVLLSIKFNDYNWTMKINVESGLNLKGKDETFHLPKLKKRIILKYLTKEEKLAKMFFQIIENILASIDILDKFYTLYYSKIDDELFLSILENIYSSTKEKLNINEQIKKINNFKENKIFRSKWHRYTLKKTDIKFNLNDIQFCLINILAKLKERVV